MNKLVNWLISNKKIDYNLELDFLRQCEKNGHTNILGKSRFLEILKNLKHISNNPKKILDVGGSDATAQWLSSKFPGSKVTILNISKNEINKWQDYLIKDGANFDLKSQFDLIFLGEILEHTYNPDGVIASSILSLKKNGYIIITTPNLACLYNRIFMLFGWSPVGYYPSLRYMTGNPIFKNKVGKIGVIMDHKSVFTWKGLVELLKLYNLEIITSQGYEVLKDEKEFKVPQGKYQTIGSSIRPFLNKLIPKSMRVGMMFVCQLKKNIDKKNLKKSIIEGNIWNN